MLSIYFYDLSCLTFRLEPAANYPVTFLLLRVTALKVLSEKVNQSYVHKFNNNQPVLSLPETDTQNKSVTIVSQNDNHDSIGQIAGIKLGKNIVSIEARISSMLIAPFASSKVKNRFFPRTMPAF